ITKTTLEERKYVEPTATKVLSWPRRRAVVGFVGLGTLADYTLDEWFRVFIAETRNFADVSALATMLRDKIEKDFQQDYEHDEDLSEFNLVIHLGGFTIKGGFAVPVMYHIWNHYDSIDPKTGEYPPAGKTFQISEDIEENFKKWPQPEDYPARVRHRLQKMVDERSYLWFSNGANLGAFNVFRNFVWHALHVIQDHGFAPNLAGLGARIAFCKMSVELFGSYFTHHFFPEDRVVGGGIDVGYIPWPE
ncbi:MAG TPA: hypothetical protein VMW36_09790, partial [Patescibacteria group bacterium]|nr:hypothetical protein [Patescibacteria group bacterium]